MKTSELKKIVEDNGYRFESKEDYLFILEKFGGAFVCISKTDYELHIKKECPKEFVKSIIEYAYTPLEEREEEKKYYLKSKLKDRDLNELFVVNGGTLHDNERYLSPTVRNQFTQKEIDEMPFDTNFFQKVEVK